MGSLLEGRSILVLEDEPLISMDVQQRFHDAGAQVLHAWRLEEALRLAERPDLSAAVLDFDLGGGRDSTPVCWRLAERRVPFVFHSGLKYPAFLQWPTAPVVIKPASSGLVAIVAGLFRACIFYALPLAGAGPSIMALMVA